MTSALPITRVVLYKHGVGHFERQGTVEGTAHLALTFRQTEVSDVLKSLTVLDLDGGHISSVSYDSTKPLEQLLAEVALSIPDDGSLVGLLPQIKGVRLAVIEGDRRTEGTLLGLDRIQRRSADGLTEVRLLSLLDDHGAVRQFDLHGLNQLEILDSTLRRDLEYYLRTQLSAKKKDARTFTFFAQGQGTRRVRMSYTLEAPVWKASYRVLLPEPGTPGRDDRPPYIQGWAVVDNTLDEDWNGVSLSLVAGLPVAFQHDLYTPRYVRRPVVEVQETTGVLPPVVEEGMALMQHRHKFGDVEVLAETASASVPAALVRSASGGWARRQEMSPEQLSQAQVRERQLGDFFEYQIEHPVTIRRNQSALVPIVLRPFEGRMVLLHNRMTRPENPMRAVEFKNTTGLTLEGGPVTVLEGDRYVGEAMLDTLKPDEQRLVAYAVELSVRVLDNLDSHTEDAHRLVIREGQLVAESRRLHRRTYHLVNKSKHEYILYLDHPREGDGWSLLDTQQPVETTENFWRFSLTLPPAQTTSFVVSQQQPLRQTTRLNQLDVQGLLGIIEQKHLDENTRQALRQAAQSLDRLAHLERELEQLQRQQERIHREQGRIRENLQALGDKDAEKTLRERLVRTLSDQEDRLEDIAARQEQLTLQREAARAEFSQRLMDLSFQS
ncbi:MAG: hypothetical protein SNJ75_11155 [Gemmataceae bacterium]